MQLLASCSLEKSREFNGKLVLPNENKKTPDKVFLNIVVGEDERPEDVFKGLSGKEKCITFSKYNPTNFCPTSLEGNVFNECDLDILLNDACFPEPKGVITLVRLPKDYSDMRNLKKLCSEHPTVRFIGGKLLGVEGVRIGRYDEGKEKMSPVFDEIYDTFVEVDLNDLDGLQEIVKRTRSKAEGVVKAKSSKKSSKSSSVKKQPKRIETFSKLFSNDEEDF